MNECYTEIYTYKPRPVGRPLGSNTKTKEEVTQNQKESGKRWYESNKEARLQQKKEYYAANKERISNRRKELRQLKAKLAA